MGTALLVIYVFLGIINFLMFVFNVNRKDVSDFETIGKWLSAIGLAIIWPLVAIIAGFDIFHHFGE